MMPAGGWTRRSVLGLLIVGGGAVVGRLSWSYSAFFERPPDGDRFRNLLLDSAHTAMMSEEFGRFYLETRGAEEVDLDSLSTELMARLEQVRPWRRLFGRLSPSELDERLAGAIGADFMLDDGLCVLEGWYLSETECRLAAMKFLAGA